MTSVEARAENIECMRANIATYCNSYRSSTPQRHRVVHLDLEKDDGTFLGQFEIVYCYSILYHLRDPSRLIRLMDPTCRRLCLVETCVSFEAYAAIVPTPEEAALASQDTWIFDALKGVFHVDVPTPQPNHEEFRIDWTQPGPGGLLARAVFVASHEPLAAPLLADSLPDHRTRC